jgi:hypothetical protein
MDSDPSQSSDRDGCSLRQPHSHKVQSEMPGTYVIPVTRVLESQPIPHINDRISCRCYCKLLEQRVSGACNPARYDASDTLEVLLI